MSRVNVDLQGIVRAFLLTQPDGATPTKIVLHTRGLITSKTEWNYKSAIRVASAMDDVYIDHWTPHPRTKFAPVFVAVPIPENCPHPEEGDLATP